MYQMHESKITTISMSKDDACYMTIYHCIISKYSRPLVERLKIPLAATL